MAMKTYEFAKVHRSAILFLLWNLITLGISGCVVLSRVKKEYDILSEESPSKRKFAPYLPIYLLGFLSLGIVPLIYLGFLNEAYGELHREEGLQKPKIGYTSFVLWNVLGIFILVGPWIAFHRFFRVCAQLKTKHNEKAKMVRELEEKRSRGEPDVALAEDAPAVMPSEIPANVIPSVVKGEEKQGPAASSAIRATPGPQTIVLPPLDASSPVDPISLVLAKYAACPSGTYAVRLKPSSPVLRTFEDKEDAIAFAKELAAIRNVSVQYKKK